MGFRMHFETLFQLEDEQEIRLCFSSINLDENFNQDVKSVVFYGDVKDKKFTQVGIVNAAHPENIHESWACSRPRDSEYIQLVGLGYHEFDLTQPNNINQTIGQAVVQFYMPLERYVLGPNMVQLKWGVFPNKDSSDLNLVRGSQPFTFYNSFVFKDLYDNDLSFWAGLAVFVFSQFWGQGFLIAWILQ